MSPLRGIVIGFIAALLSFTALTLPTSFYNSVIASRPWPKRHRATCPPLARSTKPPAHLVWSKNSNGLKWRGLGFCTGSLFEWASPTQKQRLQSRFHEVID